MGKKDWRLDYSSGRALKLYISLRSTLGRRKVLKAHPGVIFSKYNAFSKAAKASLWFLISSFLQKGISVITTPVFSRLLTSAEYGEFSVFESWLSIVTIFVTFNMASGVYLQGLVRFDKERKELSSSLQGLNMSLAVAWTIIYLLFKDFWNSIFKLTTIQMLAMLMMVWATAVFNFWAAEQRVDYNYKQLVAVTVAASILKPVVGIILVINANDKVTARILGLAIVEVVVYSGFFVWQFKRGKIFFSKKYWLYALSFAVPLIPHYLSQIVLNSADRIMIRDMVGKSEAGIYSLAYSVSRLMVLFNTALLATMNPWIYQKIKDNKIEDLSKVVYPAFFGISFLNIILIVLAPEAVRLFAPASYYEAIWIIPPVALSCIFTFAYNIFAAFEFYYKKTFWISAASFVGAVLNIILNYVCIKIFGYVAAGYTTLLCFIVYAVMHYRFMLKVCDEELKRARPYNTKLLITAGVIIIVVGLFFNMTYALPYLRYLMVLLVMLLVIGYRKRIILFINELILIKKKQR